MAAANHSHYVERQMKRNRIKEEIQEGVLYVKPRKAQGKKSRRANKNARPAKQIARGGMRAIPIKRHARGGRKKSGASDHYLDTRRPQTLAELSRLITNDFKTRVEAARALGVATSTLHETLSGRRKSPQTREKICRYYNLPISVFGA